MELQFNHGIQVVFLLLAISISTAREECDEFNSNTSRSLFKLCKKVESQKSQFPKIFDKLLQTEHVEKWFFSNRDILESLVSKASSDHESKRQLEKDREQDNKISSIAENLEAMKDHFYNMLKQQTTDEVILDKKISMETESLREEIKSINKGLKDLETRSSRSVTLMEGREIDTSEMFLNLTAKIIELNDTLEERFENAVLSQAKTPVSYEVDRSLASDRDIEEKLKDVSISLRNQIQMARSQSEAEFYNLTSFVDERLNEVSRNVEARLNSNVKLVHDSITDASTAFVEDLEILRQLLANTSYTVAFLSGRDLISVRAFEDIKSTNRRHDSVLQSVSKQLQDLQHTTQDQLQTVRSSFQQTLVDFYQKISDRQMQMTTRLASLVDDVGMMKSSVRNIQAGINIRSKPKPVVVQVEEEDESDTEIV